MKFLLFLFIFHAFITDSFSQDANNILEQVGMISAVSDSTTELAHINDNSTLSSANCPSQGWHSFEKKIKDELFPPLNQMYMLFFQNDHTLTDKMAKEALGNPVELESSTINKISNFNSEFFFQKNLKENDPFKTIQKSEGIFSSTEILDLELYALSSTGILPSQSTGWNKLLSRLENYQGFILIGAVGGIIGSDNISIPLRGRLFKVQDGKVSGGYYADVSNFGLHFKPKLSAGVSLDSKYGLSMRSGISNRLNAVGNEKELTFVSSLNYNRPNHTGQNLNFSANVTYLQSFFNNNPYQTKDEIISAGLSGNYQYNRFHLSAGFNINHNRSGVTSVSTSLLVRADNSPFSFSIRGTENTQAKDNAPWIAFIFTQDLSWKQLHKNVAGK